MIRFDGRIAVFEPENSLEALMQAAVKDPDVVPAFYQALLETEIYVLTPEAPMKPGRRRSLKFQEKNQHRHGRIQGHEVAPRLHVEKTHIRLRKGARDLSWCRRAQSVRNVAQFEFLAQSAVGMPEAAARLRNRSPDERQDF
jgi:hypothetical protein